MLDGRVLGASQVEYKPFEKPPLKSLPFCAARVLANNTSCCATGRRSLCAPCRAADQAGQGLLPRQVLRARAVRRPPAPQVQHDGSIRPRASPGAAAVRGLRDLLSLSRPTCHSFFTGPVLFCLAAHSSDACTFTGENSFYRLSRFQFSPYGRGEAGFARFCASCVRRRAAPKCVQTGDALRAFSSTSHYLLEKHKLCDGDSLRVRAQGARGGSEPGAVYRPSALRENGDSRALDDMREMLSYDSIGKQALPIFEELVRVDYSAVEWLDRRETPDTPPGAGEAGNQFVAAKGRAKGFHRKNVAPIFHSATTFWFPVISTTQTRVCPKQNWSASQGQPPDVGHHVMLRRGKLVGLLPQAHHEAAAPSSGVHDHAGHESGQLRPCCSKLRRLDCL